MRARKALVAGGGAALAAVLWRRRRLAKEYVEAAYDDGSLVRLERGVEAADLLRDAREILRAARR